MFQSHTILVADADDQPRAFLAGQLAADEATPLAAEFPAQALARAAAHRPDAIVLGGLGAPTAAVEFIRRVRRSGGLRSEPSADVPILALADTADELAVLRLFEAGVDDVAAPTSGYPVLRARLRVMLGLAGARTCIQTVRLGALEVSAVTRQVWLRGEPLKLSNTEYALLSALVAEPTRVFTRAQLLRDVWGYHFEARTRTVDQHAARLRRKLCAHGDQFMLCVRGVGYRLLDAVPGQLGRAA